MIRTGKVFVNTYLLSRYLFTRKELVVVNYKDIGIFFISIIVSIFILQAVLITKTNISHNIPED